MRKPTSYPYARITADAQATARALPAHLDDLALAEAANAAWFTWTRGIDTIPPHGHTLWHIALLREYLAIQGQQMYLLEVA